MGIKRRSLMEVHRDILTLCGKGATKTQILYRCNLNSERLTYYLEVLMCMELLAKENNGGKHYIYKTTPQGARFLEGYFGIKPNGYNHTASINGYTKPLS